MAHSLFLLSVSAKGYKGNAQAKMKIYGETLQKKLKCAYMPTWNSTKRLILKVFWRIWAYTKPT